LNSIIKFSLHNKFAIWILTILVVIAGLYSGTKMKSETIPNIDVPIVMVTTVYPGASPEEILDKVTKPLELQVRNLQGVNVVSSTSMENASSIVLEYEYSKNMEKAETEVKDVISKFTLPSGAQTPSVSRLNLNAFPVLTMSLSDKGKTPEQLTEYVEKEVLPVLQGINGMGSVQVSGQQLKEVHIKFNEDKMKALGLSQDTVKGIIQGSVVKFPLGIQEVGDTEKSLVIDGNITTLEDLQNVEIPAIPQQSVGKGQGAASGAGAGMPNAGAAGGSGQAGAQGTGGAGGQQAPQGQMQQPATGQAMPPIALPTVKLKDIADVQIVGVLESISRTNGEPSISVQVVKAADANTVDVVNSAKDKMAEFQKNDPDLKVVYAFDQGKPIEESVNTMLSKALFGALFAVIIILLFLRNFRTTIISVVSIPLSLLIAIILLNEMNITLNIMTLGAMTVAIGRVVDDSIVVIENIYRRMSLTGEKLKGTELMLAATREMITPIMSSTIVTIAVFLPMGLVSGPIGEMFLPFALTIVFSLLASLLVAITVVPMMAHSLFKKGLRDTKRHDENKTGKLAASYVGILRWSLNHKLIAFGLAVILLIGSLFLVPLVGMSFLPSDEQKMAIVSYNPAPGEKQADVESLSLKAEEMLMKREGVTMVQYSVGGKNPMNPSASKQALFYAEYKKEFKAFDKEKEAVVKDLNALGGKGEWKEMNMGGATSSSNKLTLHVYGQSLDEIKPVVDRITDLIGKDDRLGKADTGLSKSYDQYTLVADQTKLSSYGLTAGQIAMALMPERERPVLTKIKNEGQEINVYIEVDKKHYKDKSDIENVTVTSPLGIQVPVKDVMKVEEGTSPNTVTLRNGRIYTDVSADIKVSDVSKVTADLKKEIEGIEKPSTVEVNFGGVAEQMADSFSQLGMAMLAAIAIVYFVLVVTFGGGLAPFAILFSLPFTVIGALVALLIAGETLSVSAMIGALMLIGIVVTNAIVLIDRVIKREKEGQSTRDALLEAAKTRLRPILMTALATIGALLPLAFGFESGGLISKGLGVTVIGGLISSTLLTLVIVPIVYEFLMKFRKKRTAEQ